MSEPRLCDNPDCENETGILDPLGNPDDDVISKDAVESMSGRVFCSEECMFEVEPEEEEEFEDEDEDEEEPN